MKINMLESIKKVKRNINSRNKNKTIKTIIESKKFKKLYFDGPRKYGYGGYNYDGRWKEVVKKFIKIYKLKKNDKVLDIGCAKGYLVYDFCKAKIDAYGVDISKYALKKCPKEIKNKLFISSAEKLPFKKNEFKLAISINTIHNLPLSKCKKAISEIKRVSSKHSFIQVDAYYNVSQKKKFLNWVLTAKTHNYPKNWIKIFKEVKYDRDYYWTILE